ncbi:MAG: Ig-like domain-containing protein [Segatella copri]
MATGATKYVAGGQVEVKCHVYQREYGHSIDTPLTTVTFVITVNENGGGEIEGGTDIKLVSSSPKDGDTDVDVNVKPVLQFNQAVSYVSNKPISQWIRLETDYGSKIYVDSHFATNIKADGTSETQVTITPQKTLQTGTHYTLIIPAGSLKLRNGSQNSNEHRIGFTTKDVNTSIANPVLKESKKGQVYDMSGRRLNAPKKGINIINGKKYICK